MGLGSVWLILMGPTDAHPPAIENRSTEQHKAYILGRQTDGRRKIIDSDEVESRQIGTKQSLSSIREVTVYHTIP
jgi:hypothetical protein